MIITFKEYMPTDETMEFEGIFEENLQLDEDEKDKLLNAGVPLWMFVDGELAGETYGVSMRFLREKEEIEDCTGEADSTCYCYSTALLSRFRGKGLGKILKAHWLGMMRGACQVRIVGHATSPEAVHLNKIFGAQFGAIHKDWFGTKRSAIFYWINLYDTI
jgi:GNAT superfamily N-acetyltransferase